MIPAAITTQNLLYIFNSTFANYLHNIFKSFNVCCKKKYTAYYGEAYGQLVLLSFDVTIFTLVAYQRHRL